ncbi:unnamed protein product, partial [Laminaria digitata]
CGFCGAGPCKTWVHSYPTGKKAPQVLSRCGFAPKSDERLAAVTLSPKTVSKGSAHASCTKVPLKCLFCKEDRWVWKYSMAQHMQKEH